MFFEVLSLTYHSPITMRRSTCGDGAARSILMRWQGVPLEVYADGPLLRSVVCRYEYIRHDTTNLFAALNVLDGTVLVSRAPQATHQFLVSFHLDRHRGDDPPQGASP